MPHDIIFNVITPNDAGKIVCLQNVVQHIFYCWHVKMKIDINVSCIVVE